MQEDVLHKACLCSAMGVLQPFGKAVLHCSPTRDGLAKLLESATSPFPATSHLSPQPRTLLKERTWQLEDQQVSSMYFVSGSFFLAS